MKNTSKYILLLTYNIFIITNSFSQEIKIYNGVFNKGTAIYQYYDNIDKSRIYDGSFLYKTYNSTLEGFFKNNKKEGLWKYLLDDKEYGKKIELLGHFDNGKLIGEWIFVLTRYDKLGDIILKETKSVFFNKNKFSGKLNSSYISKTNSKSVTIYFNDEGFIDRILPIIYNKGGYPHEATFEFSNGILYKSLVRNLSDGNIIENFDKYELVNTFNLLFSDSLKMIEIDENIYTKDVYMLHFIDSIYYDGNYPATSELDNYYTEFLYNNYLTKSKCKISELVSDIVLDSDSNFEFQSLITSKTDIYTDVILELIFWFDVISGQIYNFPKGNNFEVIFPEVALSKIILVDGEYHKIYFVNDHNFRE